MSKLMESFRLKNMVMRNRVIMPPMCMFCADQEGFPNEWHFTHYTTRAVGGVGLIIMEATGVESRGRISDHDLGLWKEEQIDKLKKIVQACKSYGACMGIQLAHAGRKSEVQSEPSIAPSPIAFSEDYRVPQEMTLKDIKDVQAAFREAARRADLAGFDVIEIHAAHGYLINEFLSPLTNHRTDEYGGSEENRVKFLKEILQEVKSVWPKEKPILVRVSAEEYTEGGMHAEMMANILKDLKMDGIDIVDVSSGGLVNIKPKVFPGYQVKFAETIKKVADIPVVAGGLITSPLMAEEIVENERADFVFIGRELLRNPYWVLHSAKEVRDDIEWPVPYQGAKI